MEGTPEHRLIPTRYRTAIAKALSYPVGAEIVTAALTGVPQFEALTLSFYHYGPPANLMRRIAHGAEIGVFTATYWHPRWLGTEEWDLTVYAVPNQLKRDARRLLVEHGLSRVRSWLAADHPPIWYYGRKTCSVLVRFDEGELVVRED